MATLKSLGKVAPATKQILFVGDAEITNLMDSNDEPYYVWKLAEPIVVGCSVNPDIERFEADELYLRESALASDLWESDDKGNLFIPGWVADFSVGQRIPIYQETTIKKWAQGNRGEQKLARTVAANNSIRAKIEARKAKKDGN